MNGLLALSRAIDRMNDRVGNVASWCVLLACVISAGNATIRYTFDMSSNAWLEIQWYLFGGMFLLGASYTFRTNGHVRVDLLYGLLKPRQQVWLDLFGTILFMLPAVVIIGSLAWPFFVESWSIHEMSNNAGGLVRWPVKFMIPLGFAFLFLQGLSEIVKRIAILAGRMEPGPQYEKPKQ
jgi:TRAP-type mannitol/chloroaromatic compound transport system permease small subunit